MRGRYRLKADRPSAPDLFRTWFLQRRARDRGLESLQQRFQPPMPSLDLPTPPTDILFRRCRAWRCSDVRVTSVHEEKQLAGFCAETCPQLLRLRSAIHPDSGVDRESIPSDRRLDTSYQARPAPLVL